MQAESVIDSNTLLELFYKKAKVKAKCRLHDNVLEFSQNYYLFNSFSNSNFQFEIFKEKRKVDYI